MCTIHTKMHIIYSVLYKYIYIKKKEWEEAEKARKADKTTSKGYSFITSRFLK